MESSNINEVVAWIEDFVRSFDFTRPGKDQSLGRDVVNVIIRGQIVGGDSFDTRSILGRAFYQRRGADTRWKENAPDYREWKGKKYGVYDMPNVRTGQMLSEISMRGRTEYGPTEIVMKYGTGDPPSSSASPNQYLSEQDQAITDVDKAYYATNSHDRPFYEIDDEIEEAVLEEVAEALAEYIQTEGD
jgi:hypothetical protein